MGLLSPILLSPCLLFPWLPCSPNSACFNSAACLFSHFGLNLQAWILVILLRLLVALVLPERLCGFALHVHPSLLFPSHPLAVLMGGGAGDKGEGPSRLVQSSSTYSHLCCTLVSPGPPVLWLMIGEVEDHVGRARNQAWRSG